MDTEHLITHYTSDTGFECIVKNKSLLFTDIRYLNDYSEQNLYISGVRKCICDTYEEPFSVERKLFDEFCFEQFKNKNDKKRIYVFSCSLEDDSLPLWNYYSKNTLYGGYNLTFDKYELLNSIAANCTLFRDQCLLLAGPIYYSKAELDSHFRFVNDYALHTLSKLSVEEFIKILIRNFVSSHNIKDLDEDELYNICEKEFDICSAKRELEKYNNFDCYNNNNIFVERLSQNGIEIDSLNMEAFFKQQKFMFEREFRIAIQIPVELLPSLEEKGLYKMRLSHGLFVPCLEVPFELSTIKKIKISPINSHSNCIRNIEEFVNIQGCFPEVSKSRITVDF